MSFSFAYIQMGGQINQVNYISMNWMILYMLFLFIYLFLINLFTLFLFLFLVELGLCCCARAFSGCGERGLLFIAVCRLLIAVSSLVAELGL